MRFVQSLILLILIATGSPHAVASPLSSWAFRVLRTDHFEIIYRDNQKPLAKQYALAAEQAYELLFPIFKEAPDKTIILISDETDSTNGLATFLPYPMIVVYPVVPTILDSIDDYGDWPFEMIVHEYTHILNMSPAHGFYVPLKWIFGGVIRPNAILPKWYLEGLAVNMESRLTDHGRLRAVETQATARALVLGGHLRDENISRINEQELSTWPYGSRPYLFGGWWWNSVQAQYGAQVIETWNQNFARRLPFFLNGPMSELTQKPTEGLLQMTDESLESVAGEQLKILRASSPHTGTAVTAEDGEQTIFALSPSFTHLVYWVSTSKDGTDVTLKTRTSVGQPFKDIKSEKLFKASGTLRVRWIDEGHFVFDQLDLRAPSVTYRDIFLYDLAARKTTRLTEGVRAQEPTPSPKGERIAFIQNDGGRNRLAVMPLDTKQIKILVNGGYQQRLSAPEFISDNELLFSVRMRSGIEKLYVYNFAEHKPHVWNETLTSAQNPKWTAQGVMVTDASTRVRNVYLVKPGRGPAQALTNTLTEMTSVDFDGARNELIASELTPQGRRLVSLPRQVYLAATIEPLKMDPPPKVTTTKVKIQEEGYWPIEYLWPRYWIPFIYPVENGILVQGTTSNGDPAGRNHYTLNGAYDSITKKPSYGASYVNSSLPTDIGLSYGKSVTYLGASARVLESQAANFSLTNTWPFNNRFTRWSVGGLWTETESSLTTYRRSGPTAGIQYSRLQHPLNTWYGIHAAISHEEFLAQKNYLAYGRTYAHLAEQFQLGGGNRAFFQTRAALSPRLPFTGRNVTDLGDRTVGGNYLVSLTNSEFLLRGYASGAFVGRKILNSNLEYILPAMEIGRGWGTFPMFFKALELAIFADAVSVDGGAFNPSRNGYERSDLSHFYMGTGAELRMSTTTGYHLPVSFTLGAYYGLNQRYGGGFTPFVGLGLGDLDALENKTP